MMFYQSRFYDPALGRFTQADSIVPGGVQGLDRYAYVGNSPLVYIDPSGHTPYGAIHDSDGDAKYAVAILNVNLSSSIPYGEPRAQYHTYGDRIYYKLCGQISLSMIFETITGNTETLDSFIAAKSFLYVEDGVLIEDGVLMESGTGAGDLGLLFQSTFPGGWQATYYQGKSKVTFGTNGYFNESALSSNWWVGADGQNTMKDQIAGMISNGGYVIIGVFLDTATGRIISSGGVPHWVVLTGIAGNTAIINDPFDNQIEYYGWNLIEDSIMNSLGTIIQIQGGSQREEEYGGRL